MAMKSVDKLILFLSTLTIYFNSTYKLLNTPKWMWKKNYKFQFDLQTRTYLEYFLVSIKDSKICLSN